MRRLIPQLFGLVFAVSVGFAQEVRLADTEPLEWPEAELPGRLMDGAHRFVDRKIAEAMQQRSRFWPEADATADEWSSANDSNRKHLATILGVVENRLPPAMEYFGTTPSTTIVFEDNRVRVMQVRWAVLDGVFGEGLLVTPTARVVASVVLIPDAEQTAEQLLGMRSGIPEHAQVARRLVANNIEVLIPTLVSREKLQTDDERLRRSDQTHREWLYRQAFHMGRHVIGYELQIVLGSIDWFVDRHAVESPPIAVAGYGDGGLIAFYAAALDRRIQVALVSGHFDSRELVWSEPIDRNVWSLLNRFGDAEIASMILPRRLIVEYSPVPAVTGQKGELSTPPFRRVHEEWERIRVHSGSELPTLVSGESGHPIGPYSEPATSAFFSALGIEGSAEPVNTLTDARSDFDASARQQRLVGQIENHVQQLVRRSEHVREQFFLNSMEPELLEGRWSTERRHPVHNPESFIEASQEFRQRFAEHAIGQFDEPGLPFNPRTRVVAETDSWTAHDVVLDVFDDLIAWGVLVLPKDLRPGERRPVVVCQHGRNGVPRDTVDAGTTAYNDFAARLAERGFITFAPHNLYRGEDRYRWLDRKANTIGCTLFSFIVAQHDQILRWLAAQPFVDSDRIAFYGLSYGGETAVRVPPILEQYCLSICSGDFNQWTRKVAATDQQFSFMNTIEWEMPYWNLGHTFDYAEMAFLIFPRPFMVERGHHDRVGRDQWVAHEFAKVRWLYAQFDMADRVEIEFFQGGHSINGDGSFAFLHKHLDWPETQVDEEKIRSAVTLYASFDEEIRADVGDGSRTASVRTDDPDNEGRFIISPIDSQRALSISPDGLCGGALQGTDVLPNRGRLFFPAAGNIAFRPDGWSGSVSFWLKTNPDTMLKTKYCDPVQITQRRAGDGGLWIDFPDTHPRSLRLGAFRALADGEQAASDDDPMAPLIVVPNIGFQSHEWHHIAMTWTNFDTGKPDSHAALFIDGKQIGRLHDREIAMKWTLNQSGIYFAVNYIGLFDEFAVFNRELSTAEIQRLYAHPDLLSDR